MNDREFLSHKSLLIENFFRHGFLFELTQYLLLRNPPVFVTILNAEVDDSGVDLVLNCGSVTRHIQMKTLNKNHAPNPYHIAKTLFLLPGGCVIWTIYDKEKLSISAYHIYGEKGNEKISPDKQQVGATRKKNGEVVSRPGYVHVKTGEADRKGLKIGELADYLFDLSDKIEEIS